MARILILVLGLVGPATTLAQQSDNISVVGRLLPGLNNAVYASGNYAYINAGASLIVVDISEPANVKQVALHTPSPTSQANISHLQVQGNYLYLTYPNSLRILDISDPTNPLSVGTFNAQIVGLAVLGSHAYLTSGLRTVSVLDITDPANPALAGVFDSGDISASNEIVVQDRYAYVSYNTLNGYRGLRIIDVSDPSHPTLAGALPTPQTAFGISVSGSFAYLAHGPDGVRIVDVSNPQFPFSASLLPLGISFTRSVFARGQLLYAAGFDASAFHIIDVTNPAQPQILSALSTSGFPWALHLQANYIYLADYLGLRLIDVSDPSSPRMTDYFGTASTSIDVTVADNRAYIVNGSTEGSGGGMQIVDASNLASPKLRSVFPGDISRRVSLQGQTAYFTDVSTGFKILDVSNASDPRLLGQVTDDPKPWGLFVSDDFAYVTDWAVPGHFSIIDIRSPTNPLRVSTTDVGFSALDISVQGDFAYVATVIDGLKILDISHPEAPQEIARFNPHDNTQSVVVRGNLAYVVSDFRDIFSDFAGLRIVDVSDPANPREISSLNMHHGVYSIFLDGRYAYLCVHNAGLRIVDVGDPMDPQEVGFFVVPGSAANHAFVQQDLIYLANGTDGVYVLRFSPP
jgi:hypothetical protein